jgi:hypothetical protein
MELRLDARMLRPLAYEAAHRSSQADVIEGSGS